MLYNSLIKPDLEYGNVLWGHSGVKDIFSYQKKIVRHVACTDFRSHTDLIFNSLKILKLNDLTALNTCKMVNRLLYGPLPINLQQTIHLCKSIVETRATNDNLVKPLYSLKSNKNSFFYNAPLIWNSLEPFYRQITNWNYQKSIIKNYFLNNYLNNECHEENCYSCKQETV